MTHDVNTAKTLLAGWKGDRYAFGGGVLDKTGEFAAIYGKRTVLVAASLGGKWMTPLCDRIAASLDAQGISYVPVMGAAPNAPREDVYRIALEIARVRPDSVIAVGGGSTIDAAKCANVLATFASGETQRHLGASPALASSVEPYFGADTVTRIRNATGRALLPMVAVQTVASSAAHLTKYSNITDPATGQKKLIIDMAIVPPHAVFDYDVTIGAPKGLTMDGALDGISHMWEVFMGATGKEYYGMVERIAVEGIRLIVERLPTAIVDPADTDARAALGYGTDLGGYAIMLGGTNGGHLGSFSLVDVVPHGRACALLNPYYTVLFSSAIQPQLRSVGAVFRNAGFITADLDSLNGRDLALAVAEGMTTFSRSIGFPVTLAEAGAKPAHIERMIAAAKNPQLASKLQNMPTPMSPAEGHIDTCMRPVLEAAYDGDFNRIRTM